MRPQVKTHLKLLGALALVGAAIAFIVQRGHSLWQSGEDGARVWFYDVKEKQLFAAPVAAIPPVKGIHGQPPVVFVP